MHFRASEPIQATWPRPEWARSGPDGLEAARMGSKQARMGSKPARMGSATLAPNGLEYICYFVKPSFLDQNMIFFMSRRPFLNTDFVFS